MEPAAVGEDGWGGAAAGSGVTLRSMAKQMNQVWRAVLGDLRVHPIRKLIRAQVGTLTVVDTRAALLVWEPRRVVGSYAVPERDVAAELVPERAGHGEERPVMLEEGPPVLDPSSPFAAHSTNGEALTVRTASGDLPGAAFRATDPDLAGYVILDWAAFDAWLEEDEQVWAHPRDPFDRIDCLRSSRHVTLAHAGVSLADSRRPTLLFETHLPPRYYLPREDLAFDLFEPSPTRTWCAYKGEASYWSVRIGDELVPDLAWSYEDPLNDAAPVRGLVALFTERLDVTVDGEPQVRPRTPWS